MLNRAFVFTFSNQMNPNTDYSCLKTFGSYFSEDIRIPAVSFYVTSGLYKMALLGVRY